MYLEHIQEVCKEEVFVNVGSDVVGQLIHETLIISRLDGVVLVILPVVFEVQLKLLGHVLWQWLVVVEMSQESKPLGEIL